MKSAWSLKKPLGLKRGDKRYKRYLRQLKKNGFCDPETWSLDVVIAEFILPRLIRFKEISKGYPNGLLTEKKWISILDKMIFSFEYVLNTEEGDLIPDKLGDEKFEEGMVLFAEYFRSLWW